MRRRPAAQFTEAEAQAARRLVFSLAAACVITLPNPALPAQFTEAEAEVARRLLFALAAACVVTLP